MSTASSHTYETMYVMRPGTSDADAATINQKIDTVVGKFSGKLMGRDDWGVKELAYMVKDQTNGKYFVIQYTGKMGVVEEIERHFKILDDVIRFMTVQVPANYDYEAMKKQLANSEEEMKRNREARKKGPGDFR